MRMPLMICARNNTPRPPLPPLKKISRPRARRRPPPVPERREAEVERPPSVPGPRRWRRWRRSKRSGSSRVVPRSEQNKKRVSSIIADMPIQHQTKAVSKSVIRAAQAALQLPVTRYQPRNLYELLARQPLDGVGAAVRPKKYTERGYPADSYYRVVYSNLDPASNRRQGDVWAHEYWKGKFVGKHHHPSVIKRIASSEKWELAEPCAAPTLSTSNQLITQARELLQANKSTSSTSKDAAVSE
ncbi:hypothetical protein BC828DRAFT_371899 [Blastocladiella britannica]|nr:hypothetical protein BC828DRAFT_371899 [Blastocladiella britannica]